MWTLEGNANNPGKIHYLPCGSSLMVSRKDGHVLLQDDNSISRQHASITITHTTSNLKETNALPVVKLRDLGAKYGTYINDGIQQDLKIVGEQTLVDGDRVRFGMLTNTWRLKYHPLVVTTSALQPSSKVELQSALVKLGGHLILEWTASCSYLVMNTISLTVKVVCALAAARRIVTPEFFSKWVDAVENRTPHPDASQSLPPLEEVSINQSLADFSPKEERRQVLSGLNFIFPSLKQLKRMGPVVTLAGGTATLITEENARLVTSTNYLLVQLPDKRDPVMSGLFVSAKEILKKNGLRVIPESDIGLAILYLSTENHCNPSFRVSNILKRNGSASTQSQEGGQIYATETQDGDDNSMSLTGTRVVPESVASSRRTPATLPGTSFPVSGGSGIPGTLTNSSSTSTNASSTSTNASMLAPPESPLPRKSDPEDKANVLQSTTRKRLRTVSNEFAKPQAKRSSKPINGEAHPSVPEPTQPMEDQDEEEEDQLAESKFEPEHFSTQTNNTSVKKTVVNDIGNPSNRRQVKSLSTLNVSNNVENTRDNGDVSLEPPTIGRSIPFEPYTLPSLNVESRDEDEVSTQPYVDVKEEPASLPLDEPDCHSGKRRREEELNVQNEEDPSGWFVTKKNRTTNNINNTQVKGERSSLKDYTSANPQNIKQEQHEDDPFSLPIVSGRSRRAEAKRKMAAEESNANAADVDPFSVPSSSRAERGRKLLKTEDGNSRIISNRETLNEPPVTTQQTHPHITPSDERRCTSKNETWISKKSEESVAAPATVTTKAEPRYGDVADLSGEFEKSLVVVEVASLVRRREKMVATSDTQNTSFGNLKNFKKFRKSGTDIMSLPKIIGGKDLVPHDVVTVRREDWFRENPDVTMLYEEREAQERSNDNDLDALFDLPVNPRSRARMRR